MSDQLPESLTPIEPDAEYLRSIASSNSLPALLRGNIMAALRWIDTLQKRLAHPHPAQPMQDWINQWPRLTDDERCMMSSAWNAGFHAAQHQHQHQPPLDPLHDDKISLGGAAGESRRRTAPANDKLIDSMCLTFRHDFGLNKTHTFSSGMTDGDREHFRHKMRQLLEHHGREIAQLYVQPPADDQARRDALRAEIINTPELANFSEAIRLEALHQRERWGSDHDDGKEPEDWLWLIGYLATKATQAARYGDLDKYIHHIITCGAACLNWHANATGEDTRMEPDHCVIDEGRLQDCTYAKGKTCKTQCGYWKPITRENNIAAGIDPDAKLYPAPALPAVTDIQILARGWYHHLPAGEETGLDADDYEIHDADGFNSGLPPCPECIPCLIIRDTEREAALGGGDVQSQG